MTVNVHEFESMDFKDQCEVFFKTPFDERGELVLRSQEPDRLVQSLSPEEMFFMVRASNREMIPELIKHTTFQQVEFMVDLDCWVKDRLDRKSFIQWLEYLLEADIERLRYWLAKTDMETLVAGFMPFLRVLKPDHEWTIDEVIGDEQFFSFDHLYYICVDSEHMETFKRSIELLFQDNKPRYIHMMEAMMSDYEAEAEEEAFRKRQARLSERGFPDREDAFQIYRPLMREEWYTLPTKDKEKQQKKEGKEPVNLPDYPILWQQENIFLDHVLLTFKDADNEFRETFHMELVWLSNKLMVCEGFRFSEEQAVRESLQRVKRYISVGLESLSGKDVDRAHRVLSQRWLEHIFRWGFTQMLTLRTDAEKTMPGLMEKFASKEDFIEFLDVPYGFIVNGVLRSVPQYWDKQDEQTLDLLRDFKSLDEVEDTRSYLKHVEELYKCVTHPELWHGYAMMSEASESDQVVTWVNLLMTWFAYFVLGKSCMFRPLTGQEVQQFVKKVFEADQPKFQPKLKESFVSSFSAWTGADVTLSDVLFQIAFGRAEDELVPLKHAEEVDARFIETLLVNPA